MKLPRERLRFAPPLGLGVSRQACLHLKSGGSLSRALLGGRMDGSELAQHLRNEIPKGR